MLPHMAVVEQVERAVVRAIMALPERVHRIAAGRPRHSEGQTLAADLQMSLRLDQLTGEPAIESLSIPEGRQQYRRLTRLLGGTQRIGATHEITVGDRRGRLYVPRVAGTPGPLLVWFHGGGWVYGDLDTHDPVCRFLAERAGVRVLSVDYRLAPEHPFPAAWEDCLASYRWVVEHAAVLGADPTRLAVGGDSAGGTLSASTAIEAAREGLPLAFQLLVYPGSDMRGDFESRRRYNQGLALTQEFMDIAKASYLPRPEDVVDHRASPLLGELPVGLAPAYVVTAGFDPLRDEGEAYAGKLADAGVAVELRRFPALLHGFIHYVGVGRSGRAALIEIAGRLRAALV